MNPYRNNKILHPAPSASFLRRLGGLWRRLNRKILIRTIRHKLRKGAYLGREWLDLPLSLSGVLPPPRPVPHFDEGWRAFQREAEIYANAGFRSKDLVFVFKLPHNEFAISPE